MAQAASIPRTGSGDGAGEHLARAREAYARRDWLTARGEFRTAAAEVPLSSEDEYALANCAWWLGDTDVALAALAQAYRDFETAGDAARAALTALDIAYTLMLRGEEVQASGWFARTERHLAGLPEAAVHGYQAFANWENAFAEGDLDRASDLAARARQLAERHADRAVAALASVAEGRVLVRRGSVARGLGLLDEAMLAALAGDLPPDWAGSTYCHLMAACEEIADLRRAAEWTALTARWCEGMPGAGPFLGACRVHRARVFQLRGRLRAAERAARWVLDAPFRDLGSVAEARYLIGDVFRARGDLAAAREQYAAAHRLGLVAQPGLALLALAAGDVDGAARAIRTALATAGSRDARARLLASAVDILLAAGSSGEAGAVVVELEDLAREVGTAGFRAQAAWSRGTLALQSGAAGEAVGPLLDAARLWQELGVGPEVIRAREALAQAYGLLGDDAAARLERAAAARARAEVAAADAGRPGPAGEDGAELVTLTPREQDVLRLLSGGRSNAEIAAALFLSVRTVERHLAMAYERIGVSGRSARAAAVAFAYREGLVGPADDGARVAGGGSGAAPGARIG